MYYVEVFTKEFKLLFTFHDISIKQAVENAKTRMSSMHDSYHFYVYELIPEATYVYEKELMHVTRNTLEFINV